MPVSRSATPTTIPNSESCSAMYDMLSAVVSAVSVTHMFRSPFSMGGRSGVFAARASSLVWLAGRGEEAAHLGVPLAFRGLEAWMLHHLGELLRPAPVLIASPFWSLPFVISAASASR